MSASKSVTRQNHPPREWVDISPEKEDGDPPIVSSFIAKFYWRERETEPDELHVVFQGDNGEPDSRYRYFEVPRDIYNEMYHRVHNPGDYDEDIGTWFYDNVRGEYEYERYKN